MTVTNGVQFTHLLSGSSSIKVKHLKKVCCGAGCSRQRAGLGDPPSFTTNASESMNALLKNKVDYKKNELPALLDKLKEVIDEQERELERAVLDRGKYKFRPECQYLVKLESDWFLRMLASQREAHLKKVAKANLRVPDKPTCTYSRHLLPSQDQLFHTYLSSDQMDNLPEQHGVIKAHSVRPGDAHLKKVAEADKLTCSHHLLPSQDNLSSGTHTYLSVDQTDILPRQDNVIRSSAAYSAHQRDGHMKKVAEANIHDEPTCSHHSLPSQDQLFLDTQPTCSRYLLASQGLSDDFLTGSDHGDFSSFSSQQHSMSFQTAAHSACRQDVHLKKSNMHEKPTCSCRLFVPQDQLSSDTSFDPDQH